jgi:uncharacterized protein YecE (DUF72 family)
MLYIGTSGWAYPRWKPGFYPADLPEREFLEFYSSRLNAVEVNYTFCGRHAVRPHVAERWLAQTHPDFLFAFRGPKPITHFYRHRLRGAEDRIRQFEKMLLPFRQAGRLGPVLFQLPETFTIDASTLDDFLRRWPRELRVSFEFRNPTWFTDEIYGILRRRGAALCLAERDESATPEVLTAGFAYLRLRKSTYSAASLARLARRISDYAKSGDVFAFFRQSGEDGPFYARRMLRKFRASS